MRAYSRAVIVLGAALAVATLAACAPSAGQPDYRESYAIKAENRTFSIAVRMASQGDDWRIQDRERVDIFVGDYLRRARTPLTVATPPSEGQATDTRMRTLLVHLVQGGVNPDSIEIKSEASGASDQGFVLSFRGYEVKVPDCGDWSGEAGFNPTNMPTTNYGCSYQRNLGLMLSDPGDLVRSRAIGSRDAQRVDTIIRNYRAGTPTDAVLPKGEKGTFAEVGS